jgi:hypothetical protein
VKTRDFEWNTNITLSHNKNKVKSLSEGVDYYRITTAPFSAEIGAVVGEEYGVIRTTNYLYDAEGHKLVDPNTGLYLATDSYESVASIYPDVTGGWVNTFRYKNFDASIQFDFSRGGHYFSTTYMWGMYCGMFEETAANGVRGERHRDRRVCGRRGRQRKPHPECRRYLPEQRQEHHDVCRHATTTRTTTAVQAHRAC